MKNFYLLKITGNPFTPRTLAGASTPTKGIQLASPWQILAGNLAVVALFVLGWAHARYWLRATPKRYRVILFGLTMGIGTIATMSMAISFDQGVFFDLRSSLLVVTAFFGGLPAALITTAIALAYRILLGGAGIYGGTASIVVASLLGLGIRHFSRSRQIGAVHLCVLGLAAAFSTIVAKTMLPGGLAATSLTMTSLQMLPLNFLATALAGLVHVQARRLGAERDLLAAAMAQTPDYTYVKDRRGRYAAVNVAVAKACGFDDPADMIGRTDAAIQTRERALALHERERKVLTSGESLLDHVEEIPGHGWFSSSTVPLRNSAGEVIGIAGVTRDVTLDRKLQQELIQSRDTLSFALQEMSDGLAMFDKHGRLVFSNAQYRQSFPLSGNIRQPGVHMKEILRSVVESGEQLTVPERNTASWVNKITGNLRVESEEVVSLYDGRWLQIRTRPASTGATLVVVTDVTRIKHAELALHSATDELKELVRTDSLTGLLNRRAFDDTIENEIRRSSRSSAPLSLLLIDVDRFKPYNDHYGHQAGDAALRRVAEILKASLKRPADVAARYGGEEFAAVLPDTDEDGAYLVAEAFRRALAEMRIDHRTSERGYLTASIGVATYMPEAGQRSSAELIQVADEALYSAKAAGRDRVFGKRVASSPERFAKAI
ncbi:diguanylate cyclase [Devosia submarina]|uniref:diguanylate cyclase n=1 Tax=Devosia submarina TaxID=1173082 RepID=UPI000D3568EA|nr:diguanylate cyclase [Devosia submarina]